MRVVDDGVDLRGMESNDSGRLRLEHDGDHWCLVGEGADQLGLVDEYLSHLGDRNYSPKTLRAYGFDLVVFGRWLLGEGLDLEDVTTPVLLRFLAACRAAWLPGRPGPNVVDLRGRRLDGYAATTINRRLVAVSGLFAFRAMRDPTLPNPVPKGREAHRVTPGGRTGLLAHLVRRPRPRSALRLREPTRLPRPLNVEEATRLLGSLRTWRDRAIAGLMLYCGLRSCEVLALDIADVDIGRGWLRVWGKGARERAVPLDGDVAQAIQAYLFLERPESDSTRVFLVSKGPHRGQPLTAAGLRTIFRYHRGLTGVTAGHPHALRHSFGTALAEAGVDLAVMQTLLGHAHVDTTARYIHLAPKRVKEEFDAARARIRRQV
ncbi:tyrosine-type recombinase/integrase [Nocardia sp. NPDC059228]|uniref:tyrosine-type recombinase/integrase n=1 Tax=Nocardia sp. NPDC059228 TaxID=3346777 RepID=UPI00369F792B